VRPGRRKWRRAPTAVVERAPRSGFASTVSQCVHGAARFYSQAVQTALQLRADASNVCDRARAVPSHARASRPGPASAVPRHAGRAACCFRHGRRQHVPANLLAEHRAGSRPAAAAQRALRTGFASAVPQHAGGRHCKLTTRIPSRSTSNPSGACDQARASTAAVKRSGFASAVPQHAGEAALLHRPDRIHDRAAGLLRTRQADAHGVRTAVAGCERPRSPPLPSNAPCAPASPPPSRSTRAGGAALECARRGSSDANTRRTHTAPSPSGPGIRIRAAVASGQHRCSHCLRVRSGLGSPAARRRAARLHSPHSRALSNWCGCQKADGGGERLYQVEVN
jgi:hypothetical protein